MYILYQVFIWSHPLTYTRKPVLAWWNCSVTLKWRIWHPQQVIKQLLSTWTGLPQVFCNHAYGTSLTRCRSCNPTLQMREITLWWSKVKFNNGFGSQLPELGAKLASTDLGPLPVSWNDLGRFHRLMCRHTSDAWGCKDNSDVLVWIIWVNNASLVRLC